MNNIYVEINEPILFLPYKSPAPLPLFTEKAIEAAIEQISQVGWVTI